MTPKGGGKHEKGGVERISRWEWVAAAVGAILVFGTIGLMLHEAITVRERPVAVELTIDTVVPGPSGYLVRFTARNRGDFTAADLQVEGELLSEGRVEQTARTTIDYLPQRGSRSAGLFFELDPRRYTLRLRPVGHDEP